MDPLRGRLEHRLPDLSECQQKNVLSCGVGKDVIGQGKKLNARTGGARVAQRSLYLVLLLFGEDKGKDWCMHGCEGFKWVVIGFKQEEAIVSSVVPLSGVAGPLSSRRSVLPA